MISIFSSSKCRLFHNATLFGFCITHILNTGCAQIKKKIRRQKVKHTNVPFKFRDTSLNTLTMIFINTAYKISFRISQRT